MMIIIASVMCDVSVMFSHMSRVTPYIIVTADPSPSAEGPEHGAITSATDINTAHYL